jgi:hypothetical protein
MSEARRILGGVGDSERIIRFDGAVLAEAMYLIGQAWVKVRSDPAGADEDLDAALKLVPVDTIEAITRMIDAGGIPSPGHGPDVTDAWLEQCRLAGAGEWTLTRVSQLPARGILPHEADLLSRLARRHAAAEAQARIAAAPGADPVPHWRRVESEADFLVRLRQIRLDAEAEMRADMEARKGPG